MYINIHHNNMPRLVSLQFASIHVILDPHFAVELPHCRNLFLSLALILGIASHFANRISNHFV